MVALKMNGFATAVQRLGAQNEQSSKAVLGGREPFYADEKRLC